MARIIPSKLLLLVLTIAGCGLHTAVPESIKGSVAVTLANDSNMSVVGVKLIPRGGQDTADMNVIRGTMFAGKSGVISIRPDTYDIYVTAANGISSGASNAVWGEKHDFSITGPLAIHIGTTPSSTIVLGPRICRDPGQSPDIEHGCCSELHNDAGVCTAPEDPSGHR